MKSDDEDSSYLILVTASREGVSRYIEQIDEAVKGKEDPLKNPNLLPKRKKS